MKYHLIHRNSIAKVLEKAHQYRSLLFVAAKINHLEQLPQGKICVLSV